MFILCGLILEAGENLFRDFWSPFSISFYFSSERNYKKNETDLGPCPNRILSVLRPYKPPMPARAAIPPAPPNPSAAAAARAPARHRRRRPLSPPPRILPELPPSGSCPEPVRTGAVFFVSRFIFVDRFSSVSLFSGRSSVRSF